MDKLQFLVLIMFICLLFSVISSTATTRATLPSFEFWRTYFTTESQVIASAWSDICLSVCLSAWQPCRFRCWSSVECHGDQSWGRSSSSCMPPMCCNWYDVISYNHTRMLITVRSVDSVVFLRPSLLACRIEFLPASITCPRGCGPTGCSWIPARWKSCGAHHNDANIRSQLGMCVSAASQFNWSRQSAASASMSTVTSP